MARDEWDENPFNDDDGLTKSERLELRIDAEWLKLATETHEVGAGEARRRYIDRLEAQLAGEI